MNSNALNIKSVFILAGAFCAFFIGSGFATGQEILQYFSSHGLLGFGSVLIAMFIFTWIGSSMMNWGYQNKEKQGHVYDYYCGKVIGTFLKFFVPTFLFGVVISMIAGAGAVFTENLGLNKYVGVSLMALLILFTALLGLKKLVDILGSLGPLIIIFLLIIGIVSIIPNLSNLGELGTVMSSIDTPTTVGSWWLSGIVYTAATILSAAPFLAGMGETSNHHKVPFMGGIVGGLVVGLVIFTLTLAILANMNAVYNTAAPMITLGESLYAPIGIVFAVIIFLGIYTTATPMLWLICNQIVDERSKWYKVLVTVITLLALVGGFLIPFNTMVGFIYPYAGYIGIFFLGAVAFKQIKDRFFKKPDVLDDVTENISSN